MLPINQDRAPESEHQERIDRNAEFAARMHGAFIDGSEKRIAARSPFEPMPCIIPQRRELTHTIDNGPPGRAVALAGAAERLIAERDEAVAATCELVALEINSTRHHEGRSRPRFGQRNLLDLTAKECRWPSGEAAPYTFCGAPVAHEHYCMKHHRIGHRKGRAQA